MCDELRDQIIWWGGNVSGMIIAVIIYWGIKAFKHAGQKEIE